VPVLAVAVGMRRRVIVMRAVIVIVLGVRVIRM
jgi:hypothetical protein